MNIKALAVSALVTFGAMGTSVFAATVVNDGTMALSGGFTIQGGAAKVAVSDPHGAWDTGATTPGSEWIWDAQLVNGAAPESLTFLYTFDLTGYDTATASLVGLIGQDDYGSISINGNLFYSTNGSSAALTYSLLSGYGNSTDSWFLGGLNTVSYFVHSSGGPAGFRATINVQADLLPTPVPLPAGVLLLLTGVAGLGAMRRRLKAG